MPPKRRGNSGDEGALVEVKKRKMEGAVVPSTGKPAMQVNFASNKIDHFQVFINFNHNSALNDLPNNLFHSFTWS